MARACHARKRSNEHLFKAHLLTECAYSQTEHEPQGGEPMSAELVAHKPHCSNRNWLQLFALVLCAPLPTRRKLRFHLCNSCISSLVFVVSEPCVRSTSERTGWNYFRPRTSDTAFSRFVLPRACLPFVARNELAIATKSIASVLSPATRSPWVPSNIVQRGNGDMGATRKTTRPVDEL